MELKEVYNRWLFSRHILKKLDKYYKGSEHYEAKNIAERYLISIVNNVEGAEYKMHKEFKEKNLKYYSDIFEEIFVDDFKLEILMGRVFKVGNYTMRVDERMDYLAKNYGVYKTAITYLKYESILAGPQHWGIPWNVARHLYNHRFTNEGFASPINSRLIEYEKGRYCSIFPESDPGSLGSFFEVDLLKHSGDWSINPPMIESLIEIMVEKVLKCLNKKLGKAYFISMANWIDMPAYKKLKHSKYLKEMRVLYRDKYYYQTPDKEVIPAKFNSVYFVLADDQHYGFNSDFYRQLYRLWDINTIKR